MVEHITPPPDESNVPVPPPIDDPVVAGVSKRKAILATALVTLMAIGIVWYDPFSIFHFNVEFGENQAAQETPLSDTVQGTGGMQATCGGSDTLSVTVTWNSVPDAQVNGIERSINGGGYESIFFEGGDYPFSTFTFTDPTVQFGTQYRYRVVSGRTDNPATVSITCQ